MKLLTTEQLRNELQWMRSNNCSTSAKLIAGHIDAITAERDRWQQIADGLAACLSEPFMRPLIAATRDRMTAALEAYRKAKA